MLASVWGRNCHRLCGRKEAVFRAFFGCSGVAGFNGRCLGASSGAGGFMLACISGCRGVIGFKVGTWPCPVREKVRPAWPGVGVSAKKFALLGLVRVRARKSSPCARKMAQNWRFVACWASFSRKRGWRGCAGRVVSRISSRVILLGELCRAAALVVGPLPAVLTLQCAAKPYGWHGGQPAQPTTHRVNVRIGGPTCALAGLTCA